MEKIYYMMIRMDDTVKEDFVLLSTTGGNKYAVPILSLDSNFFSIDEFNHQLKNIIYTKEKEI